MSNRTGEVTWDEIVGLIGEAAALDLSMARGGRSLYVPSPDRVGPHCPAAAILGVAMARRLADRWGSTRIQVPNGPGKRLLVWRMKAAGKTISEIVAATRYTDRYVYAILAREPPANVVTPPSEDELPLFAFMPGR